MSQRKSFRQLISLMMSMSTNDLPTKSDINWVRREIKKFFWL
ncbi:hypothetical protein BALOs_1451 [Halobacteriovorax sp. BALOs_7]|nr:hypothetical protein [Halobacteriovorax sp. BALOs_7]AYF44452.1 hypothetical protein BALOs_1451 [Halobacteriovorax sp. BALOs_7]